MLKDMVGLILLCVHAENMKQIDVHSEYQLPGWGTQKFHQRTATLGENMVKRKFSGQGFQGIKVTYSMIVFEFFFIYLVFHKKRIYYPFLLYNFRKHLSIFFTHIESFLLQILRFLYNLESPMVSMITTNYKMTFLLIGLNSKILYMRWSSCHDICLLSFFEYSSFQIFFMGVDSVYIPDGWNILMKFTISVLDISGDITDVPIKSYTTVQPKNKFKN